MLNFCDFIQVYVLTINHHLKHMGMRIPLSEVCSASAPIELAGTICTGANLYIILHTKLFAESMYVQIFRINDVSFNNLT